MQGDPMMSEVAYKEDMTVHGASLDRFFDGPCGDEPVPQPKKQSAAGVAVRGVVVTQEIVDLLAVYAPGDVAANDRQGRMR